MTEQSWRPLFRTPTSSVTKVLRSPTFAESRERALEIIEDAAALRTLANIVETLDHSNAPLAAVADRVAAAVRFLRARSEQLDAGATAPGGRAQAPRPAEALPPAASSAARERLIVAALDYLITPVDLVPDLRPGGYVDDVLLLTWVFGAAVNELEPFLEDDPDS